MRIAVKNPGFGDLSKVLLVDGKARTCCCPRTGVNECANPCAYRVLIEEVDSDDVACGDLDEDFQGTGYSAEGCGEFNIVPYLDTGTIDEDPVGYEGIQASENFPPSGFRQIRANIGMANTGPFSGQPYGYFGQAVTGYSVTPDQDPENTVQKTFSRQVEVSFRCLNSETSCSVCGDPETLAYANVWKISVAETLFGVVNAENRSISRVVEDYPIVEQTCEQLNEFPEAQSLRWCGETPVEYVEDCDVVKDFHMGSVITVQATEAGVIVTINDVEQPLIPWDLESDTGTLTLPEPYDTTPLVTIYTAPCCCWDEEDESDTYCNPLP